MAACLSFPPVPERSTRPNAAPPAMTRCECAEVSFGTVASMMGDGCSLHDVMAQTGAGHTCTACRADLELYLATLNLI